MIILDTHIWLWWLNDAKFKSYKELEGILI